MTYSKRDLPDHHNYILKLSSCKMPTLEMSERQEMVLSGLEKVLNT